MTAAIALRIDGMTCDSCAAHVREALERVPGVRSAAVSYPKARAEIAADAGVSSEALAATVATLGYRASMSKPARDAIQSTRSPALLRVSTAEYSASLGNSPLSERQSSYCDEK